MYRSQRENLLGSNRPHIRTHGTGTPRLTAAPKMSSSLGGCMAVVQDASRRTLFIAYLREEKRVGTKQRGALKRVRFLSLRR